MTIDLLRRVALASLSAVLLTLGGCAVGPDKRDPLEHFNRGVMEFNDGLDSVVLKPAATAYRAAVPPLVRTGVSNFFNNLDDGWSGVNSLLQLKLRSAGENFLRVGVNTVFGLGGILDVAGEIGIERHREDLGRTLGFWGVPTGPYLMLPVLGPSTLRDTAAFTADAQGDLVSRFKPLATRNSLYTLRLLETRANLLRASAVLDEVALDKYSFLRDAHLQRRQVKPLDFRGDEDATDAGSTGSSAITPLGRAIRR